MEENQTLIIIIPIFCMLSEVFLHKKKIGINYPIA